MILTHSFYEVVSFCRMFNITPIFERILKKVINDNCKAAVDFVKFIAYRDKAERLIEIPVSAEFFINLDRIHEFTDFLLDALKADLPEDRDLQTRLIEINLLHRYYLADEIINQNIFTHYDKDKIAQICEQKGLKSRAL